MSASPLQNAQTASRGSRSAKHLAPNVTLAESPLDHFELPPEGSLEACYLGQPAPSEWGILQRLKARVFGDVVAQHLRKQLDDVLFAANVDLVLAGHVHAYQRSCAVHRGVCVDGGVVHITAGNSGAELKPDLVSAPWVEANLEQFGFLDITADSEKLEVRKKKYVRCHVKHTCTHRVRRSSYMRAQMGLCLIR